jgi:type II secretory pathway predicted ATPase ExeA
MYHNFFGMKQRPFGDTLQLRNLFAASGQEEALATLRYSITQGRGIGLLTGPSGIGKTLVCHRLTSSLESAFTTAMITNTNMATIKALYQAILYDLSLPYHGLDEQELRLTLTDFLLRRYAGGGRTVLIIDEAQNLSVPLLEELRMLCNLEGETDKVFQMVLVGHSRLLGVLRSPEIETLNQRIGARATLCPLGDEETVQYIQHQLQCAGVLPDEIFTYDAMTAVYEASGGIPRVINQLCEHALLLTYVSESHRVDSHAVEKASTELGLTVDQAVDEATQDSSPIAEPVSLGAALQHDFSDAIDDPAVCDRETRIPLSYAAGEDASDCLEIVPEEPAPVCRAPFDAVSVDLANAATTVDPLDEVFAQEEIIVDPYAMMDAARSGSTGSVPPKPYTPPVTKIEKPRDLPTVPELLTLPTELPCVARIEDAPSTLMFRDSLPVESPTPISFVEPSDNPAVHEVGAGVAEPAADSNEPPILVIESRSQRIAGNLGRVDVPGSSTAGPTRAYRRLFTHARKS